VFWEDHRLSSIALRPYTVYGLGRDQGLTSDLTKAMLAAVRGEPFEIGFGGAMQVQWASDVARFFIAAAQRPLEGALAFHLDTPSHSVEDVIALIGAVKPGAQITQKETRLPFPEAYAPGASSRYLPQVQETALEDGIRQTMSAFAARGMENRDGSK
jgi:nucleoside-diphosphate-sugar epimerase